MKNNTSCSILIRSASPERAALDEKFLLLNKETWQLWSRRNKPSLKQGWLIDKYFINYFNKIKVRIKGVRSCNLHTENFPS